MKSISTLAELEKAIELAARKTMEGASKEILGIFKTKYVKKYAYGAEKTAYHNPAGNEFLEAWEWNEIKKVSNTLSMEMFNNWMKMTPGSRGSRNYIHSSYSQSYPDDTREYLTKWLDDMKSPLSGDRIGGYWKNFISEMLDSNGLKKIIDKHARANGFATGGMGIG